MTPRSKAPQSSAPPPSTPEQRLAKIDLFLSNLSDRKKEILWIYVNLPLDDNHYAKCKQLQVYYGQAFSRLQFETQELTDSFGCPTDVMRRLLFSKLEKTLAGTEDSGNAAEAVRQGAQEVFLQKTPGPEMTAAGQLELEIEHFMWRLSKEELNIVLGTVTPDDGDAVDSVYRIQLRIRELSVEYDRSEEEITRMFLERAALSVNLAHNPVAQKIVQEIMEREGRQIPPQSEAAQPSAEAATNFECVLDQFLSELSDEEKIELEQDVFREEDDEVRPAGAVNARLIRRLVKSGEIDFTGDKLKRLLAPRMNRVWP